MNIKVVIKIHVTLKLRDTEKIDHYKIDAMDMTSQLWNSLAASKVILKLVHAVIVLITISYTEL
jgi:hypothetical protein